MTYIARAVRKDTKADLGLIMTAIESMMPSAAALKADSGCRDIHHDVCSKVCDDFDLWEQVSERRPLPGRNHPARQQVRLPVWVMYLVSGVMREHGISS